MDTDEIYFDDIKREVLPDGRIRYYAEKIVEEVEIPLPRSKSEIEERMENSFRLSREAAIRYMQKHNPYLNLLEGEAPAMGGDLS